jgi:COP9 signalosome complex subunit 1
VATYGGLCALATLTRPDLRVKVIDNIQFREYLEVVPEVREGLSAAALLRNATG